MVYKLSLGLAAPVGKALAAKRTKSAVTRPVSEVNMVEMRWRLGFRSVPTGGAYNAPSGP